MESKNLLIGGINKDVSPLKQGENSVREMINFVLLDNGGSMFSISNEEGTILFDKVTFPDGFKPIGYTVLDKDIIVVLVNGAFSQVGYIRQDDSELHPTYGYYHPSAPYDELSDSYPENNSELGFSLDYPVDCTSRKLINGHRILYFTDNYNPFGRVDLDSPPLVGNVADEVKLTFNQSIPTIKVKEIKENVSGTFQPGAYQVITRYVTETGGVTTFGVPSGVIPMVPTLRSGNINDYSGAFNDDEVINKNIVVEFTDVDTQFQELEIVLVYYEGETSVFNASIIAQVPINSDTIEYTITGINYENIIGITKQELNRVNVSYTRAKCISQKDNVLFLSNLSSDREDSFKDIQLAVNQTSVSYNVNEVQYNGRGESVTTSFLTLELIVAYISELTLLTLSFSNDIDASASTLGEYILLKSGNPSSSSITIDDNTIADNDTITIGVGPSQASIVITMETTDSDTIEKCPIGATDLETAINLAQTINESPNITEYSALVNGNSVSLFWNSLSPSSDGVTIVSSQVNISTTNFSGYSNVPYEVQPTSVQVIGKLINLTFPVSVTTLDRIRVNNVTSFGDEYTNGSEASFPISLGEEEGVSSDSLPLGYTDYLNEQFTYSFKTYKRNEVYSFGVTLLYKDGTSSPVFHIPANASYFNEVDFDNGKVEFPPTGVDSWGSFNTGETTGKLGTYVSQDTYPNDQFYPGDQLGDDNSTAIVGTYARNIRHHVMPSVENEPHFRYLSSSNAVVRLINLNFALNLPNYVLEDVQKVMFVRERRQNQTNKSIYAQGLVNRSCIMADDYDNNGEVRDGASNIVGGNDYNSVKSPYFVGEAPFFNNIIGASFEGFNQSRGSGSSIAGYVFPGSYDYGAFDPTAGGVLTYENGRRYLSEFLKDRGFFYSPEVVLFSGFRFNEGEVVSANMIPVLELKAKHNFINERQEWWKSNAGKDYLSNYYTADLFINYNDYVATPFGAGYRPKIDISRYVNAGKWRISALDKDEPGLVTSTRWSTSSLELKFDVDLALTSGMTTRLFRSAKYLDRDDPCFEFKCNSVEPTGRIENYDEANGIRNILYDIKSKNIRQYGQVSVGGFITIDTRKPFDLNNNKVLSFNNIYGGDTFITKFSFNNSCLIPYWPYRRLWGSAINRPDETSSGRTEGYANIDNVDLGGTTGGGPNKAHGQDYRTCSYYFVESNINTYYRHKPKQDEEEIAQNNQDYYPNEIDISVLNENFYGYLDNIRSYNAQYSYENNVKEYFVRGSTEQNTLTFENRVIYSETAANDDTLDTFRSFLVNNYYDLPSNTGPIWDSFVSMNTLFLHTTKSLWMTFAEPSATLSGGNIDEIVLGAGGLFNRPSKEMITTEGGYGGTISQYGGFNTRVGYIFPDILQGKVFGLLVGEKGTPYLKELSEEGMQTFFKQLGNGLISFNGQIDEGKLKTPNLIDNPYNGIGINSCYDQNLKRFIMVKHGAEGFTMSLSSLSMKWFEHTYFPQVMIPYNNQLFFIKDGVTWEMNKGRRGHYFDSYHDSVVEFVCNFQMIKKTFKALQIDSESFDGTRKVRDDCFHKMMVYNSRQNTFEKKLKQANTFNVQALSDETLIKFRNDEYRVAIPRDSVDDNNADIFDPSNSDFTKLFREKIKGEYAIFLLTYENDENDYRFVVNSTTVNFDTNER